MITCTFSIDIGPKGGCLEWEKSGGDPTKLEYDLAVAIKDQVRKAFKEMVMEGFKGHSAEFIEAEGVSSNMLAALKARTR